MSEQLRLTNENAPEYLVSVGVIPQSRDVRVEPAGEGNINWVRRLRGPGGSWVVKQARPSLERFPEYRASTERIVFEARYYETAAPFDARRVCPSVRHFDPVQRVLVLEDLSGAERLDAALARGAETAPAAATLGAFLGAVHAGTRGLDLAGDFDNGEMRRLHGDHVFHLPYRRNDFPLPPAVASRAAALWKDAALVERIDAAHRRYLEPVGALVHGDVQPTNVLLAPRGAVLLDAEIAHVGDPAFDVGVLIAHWLLEGVARRRPERAGAAIEATWSAYASAHGPEGLARFRDVARYAGIEMLRRTLGAARVAAVAEDAAALAVVERATQLVAAPPDSPAALR